MARLNHLGVAPDLEILGCEPSTGQETVCLVRNVAVFAAAAGHADLAPVQVTVRDGLIWEVAFPDLCSVNACEYEFHGPMKDEYLVWLGLSPFPRTELRLSPDSDDPLFIDEVFIGSPDVGQILWIPWIDPESYAQHRELIQEWLASR